MKYHGGFHTNDVVEVTFIFNHKQRWSKCIIVDFHLLNVKIKYDDEREPFWVSIFQIRKPNIRIGERG